MCEIQMSQVVLYEPFKCIIKELSSGNKIFNPITRLISPQGECLVGFRKSTVILVSKTIENN